MALYSSLVDVVSNSLLIPFPVEEFVDLYNHHLFHIPLSSTGFILKMETTNKNNIEREHPTALKLNAERYKQDSENYYKLKEKIIRLMDTQELIKELKRRNLVHINWETMKYDFKDNLK
jgi:hypothetical protein